MGSHQDAYMHYTSGKRQHSHVRCPLGLGAMRSKPKRDERAPTGMGDANLSQLGVMGVNLEGDLYGGR